MTYVQPDMYHVSAIIPVDDDSGEHWLCISKVWQCSITPLMVPFVALFLNWSALNQSQDPVTHVESQA